MAVAAQRWTVVVICIGFSQAAFGQSVQDAAIPLDAPPATAADSPPPPAPDKASMFNELVELNVDKVYTASKSEESIGDAPANISVMTAAEIERFGASRLMDALDRFLGAQAMSTYFCKNSHIAIRGQAMDHRDKQMLWLLDGRPIRESLMNGESAPMYVTFPFGRIARIEFVRGPGSVLYGTQAVLGTINIVTKSGAAQETGSNFAFGGDGLWRAEAATGFQVGDFKLAMGGDYLADKGWLWDAANASYPSNPNHSRFFQAERGGSVNVRGEYNNFTFQGYYGALSQRRVTSDALPENTYGQVDLNIRRAQIDFGYRFNYGTDHYGTLNLTYNHHLYDQPRLDADKDSREVGYNHDAMLEYTHFVPIIDSLKLTAGATLSYLSGTIYSPSLRDATPAPVPYDSYINPPNPHPYVSLPYYKQVWYSVYAQLNFRPINMFQIYAGAQVNKVAGLPFDLTPRAGLVLHVSDEFAIKALYGEAFRSPSFFERFFFTEGSVIGNANLRPEKVRTGELLLNYHWRELTLNLSGYYSLERNIIARTSVPGTLLQTTVNLNEVHSRGGEFELRFPIMAELFVTGSAAYNDVRDQNNAIPFGLSSFIGKLGATYIWHDLITMGWFNSFYNAGPKYIAKATVSPPVDSYVWGSLKVSGELNHVNRAAGQPSVKLYGMIENLYNAGVRYPEYTQKKINSVPGRSPITFWSGIEAFL